MKETNAQYLDALATTNGEPIRHTVIFESIKGAEYPIVQSNALITAIRGLSRMSVFLTYGLLIIRYLRQISLKKWCLQTVMLSRIYVQI